MRCQKEPGMPPVSPKFLLVAGVAAAWFAQSASAGCPAGYLAKAGHCLPGPAQAHHPAAIGSIQHGPVAVSPVHAAPANALTAPRVPAGKAALNPQPIPPGHGLQAAPPPTPAPTGQAPHWDLKANKIELRPAFVLADQTVAAARQD